MGKKRRMNKTGKNQTLLNGAIMRQMDRQKYSETELVMMNALSRSPFFLDPADALNLTTSMVKRWESDYSWCKRVIVDKQIVVRNNAVHISVASVPVE